MKEPKLSRHAVILRSRKWFPIAWQIGHWCCGCHAKHTFCFRLRKRKLEMKVI